MTAASPREHQGKTKRVWHRSVDGRWMPINDLASGALPKWPHDLTDPAPASAERAPDPGMVVGLCPVCAPTSRVTPTTIGPE